MEQEKTERTENIQADMIWPVFRVRWRSVILGTAYVSAFLRSVSCVLFS